MRAPRHLIVNADDFGLTPGVSRGILLAHQHGIVTSASLMVRPPGALDAVARSREYPRLSLGLHLDLGEWTYRHGTWTPLYEVVALDDARAVVDEVHRQLDAFRTLVGRDPTHIDSHQHVHRREPVRAAVGELARDLAVPLRHFTPEIRYCGRFYGQSTEGTPMPDAIRVDALIAILATLPPGTTELACHPGEDDVTGTMYRSERARESAVLCDPRVTAVLAEQEIELCSFVDVAATLEPYHG
jgi:predicted glycoside hydrolase/deacetylase ChbG (UPF0249 family)